VVLVASWVWAALAVSAQAASTYGPGQYSAGPKHGDPHTHVKEANPDTGEVAILQDNFRQAAAVHCIGDGPRAMLQVKQPASDPISSVSVAYQGAFMTEHPVIDVSVRAGTEYIGHVVSHGPKNDESGTLVAKLDRSPAPGEVVTVHFGLQVHAGCLPHPTLLGLPGSRFVEGGRAIFTSVTIG